MSKTNIEWTNRTWNPVTGCTKVSRGCKFCYAEVLYERFNGKGSFKNVICHDDRLLAPLKWKGDQMCFVNSMSDLFHENVPFSFIDKVFATMAIADNITFQILTKRPQRMLEYMSEHNVRYRIMTQCDVIGENPKLTERASFGACAVWQDWPLKNVCLGVSAENQKTADERIPILQSIPAAIHFISCEPLVGPIDILQSIILGYAYTEKIDWIIVGGESGHGKIQPMHPAWVRDIRDQCKAASIAFLFKQWGNMYPVAENIKNAHFPNGDAVSDWAEPVEFKRMSKAKSGRTLDGVIHDEYPKRKARFYE